MANGKDGREEVQKIKLVGSLWTTKLVLSILRDILLIVFLIVVVVGIVFAITSLSSALSGAGGIGSLLSMMQEGGAGMEGVVARLQQDINNGNWNSAQDKVNQLDFFVQQSGDAQAMNDLQQMKQAISEKNTAKANAILNKSNSGSSNRG